MKRALAGAPFIFAAHLWFWPHGHIITGLVCDVVGVGIILSKRLGF